MHLATGNNDKQGKKGIQGKHQTKMMHMFHFFLQLASCSFFLYLPSIDTPLIPYCHKSAKHVNSHGKLKKRGKKKTLSKVVQEHSTAEGSKERSAHAKFRPEQCRIPGVMIR